MTRSCPKLDSRKAEDIIRWLKQSPGLGDVQEDPLGEALVRIFAHYCELVIERLNQAPEKSYRAFLNELGASRCPSIPAQVPLTFTPVRNVPAVPIVIPQYSKATSSPASGETSPAVFETNQTLTLTRAELGRIILLDTGQDRYSDLSVLARPDSIAPGAFPFPGSLPSPHEFHIDLGDLPALEEGDRLQLDFTIERAGPSDLETMLEWRVENGKEGHVISPVKDTTAGLGRSGSVEFDRLPLWEKTRIGGRQGCWLSCRPACLARPNAGSSDIRTALARMTISRIAATVSAVRKDVPVNRAFCNGFPLDLSKDFFPLGEKPRFGDVLYLDSSAFCQSDTDVKLAIMLTNPASGEKDSPLPRVSRNGRAVIQWEYWSGMRWLALDCCDRTRSLTEDGTLSFRVPKTARPTRVNGIQGGWIRARLISGHYGMPEKVEYVSQDAGSQVVRYVPSTLSPPVVQSLTVSFGKVAGPHPPEAIKTHNHFVFETIDPAVKPFNPFQFGPEPGRFLYLGLKAESGAGLAGHRLDLYFSIGHAPETTVYRGDDGFPVSGWQYRNGDAWKDCRAKDETLSFTVSGIVSVWLPEDITAWAEHETSLTAEDESRENDSALFWLRAVRAGGDDRCAPAIRKVLLNTVPATQVLTLENEILGSANGVPNPVFYAARTPVLGAPILEVKEPQRPSEDESKRIGADGGQEAVESRDGSRRRQENWVRWREVGDFLDSGPGDRHFVVERMSGEFRFGDGVHGMVPPSGVNSIRLRCYKTGGGASGNKPAHSIATLRSGIPLVASVTNHEPAAGGLDAEDWSEVYSRGSRILRHRRRAVTAADYEDLARMASPRVARARCLPAKALDSDSARPIGRPGVIGLIVVPKSAAPEPRPSYDLLREVWKFMESFRDPNAALSVLGPAYLRVGIQAVIVPAYDALHGDIAQECRTRLEGYLHPLTGGELSGGWDFGQHPHQSDVFALLDSVPGLDHVESLQIAFEEERPGIRASGRFLVCSGRHRITLV
ncbi:MAG: putative baseplate assembly protein [Gammaproteobacteria bacterium]